VLRRFEASSELAVRNGLSLVGSRWVGQPLLLFYEREIKRDKVPLRCAHSLAPFRVTVRPYDGR